MNCYNTYETWVHQQTQTDHKLGYGIFNYLSLMIWFHRSDAILKNSQHNLATYSDTAEEKNRCAWLSHDMEMLCALLVL